MSLERVLRGLLDWVAPARCPGCDTALPPGRVSFCSACDPLLEPLNLLAQPQHARALFAYGGPMAEAIKAIKYSGRTDFAHPLGQLVARHAHIWAGDVQYVVPVPLHPRRLRCRGFNQAVLFSRQLARSLGVPLAPHFLRRVRDTPPQATLRGDTRIANVRGAFRASLPRRAAPRSVLLTDDVTTSGATLAEASAAMRSAGVRHIHALALAKTMP